MSTYIVLGSPDDQYDALTELARRGDNTTWTINRNAKVGDDVLFYLTAPVSSLVARGQVLSAPEIDPNSGWENHHMSDIGDFSLFTERVHISTLKEQFPEWRWLLSPIKSAQVPDDAVAALRALLGDHVEVESDFDQLGDIDNDAIEAAEGDPRFLLHLRRERSKKLVALKRASVLKEKGCLQCEACGFDFAAQYGALAADFCEVHHLKPLAAMRPGDRTGLNDLAIVCSNCHRVIHLRKHMLTPRQLGTQLRVKRRT
jgi:predicted HNH restriction endonuclease